MDYKKLRDILSPMTRGSEVILPHPTENIKVTFNEQGVFSAFVTSKGKQKAHASSGGYTSLAAFISSIMFYYQPAIGHVYQHINGNVYKIIAIANEHSLRLEYPPTVVYEGVTNNKVWAKPVSNFMRKMTRIK